MRAEIEEAVDRLLKAGGGDYRPEDEDIYGRDFIVSIGAIQLLSQAPLDSDQREALFRLLMTAPEWVTSKGSARLTFTNEGSVEARSGRTGQKLRMILSLPAEADEGADLNPGIWTLDLVIDTDAGEVLELREFEVDDQTPEVITIDKMAVIPVRG